MRSIFVAAGAALLAAPAFGQVTYPSGSVVPANLLRVSIVFPTPQGAGQTPTVWLSKADGTEIAGAFYPQRLWSTDGRTLTIYLDPGRVKTGLVERAEHGPILMMGEQVELRLGPQTLKTWTVGDLQERRISPDFAAMTPPRAKTRTPLRLNFANPIDWQGRDLIAVQGPDGRRFDGRAVLVHGERTWSFTPSHPWSSGQFMVRLNGDLEDPEGNRLSSGFETKVGRAASPGETQEAFTVR